MSKKVTSQYSRTIEWVSVRLIGKDDSAQRPFKARRAEEIARNLDPDKLGLPLVAVVGTPPRERYIALDGQHRIAAVRMALGEDQLVNCEVVRGLTIPQAAELFLGRNTAAPPHVLDKFRVAVTAGRPAETAINDMAVALGLRIAGGAGDGTVGCVRTLVDLYRNDPNATDTTDGMVPRVLRMALAAWGRADSSFQGDVLKGLGLTLTRYAGMIDEDTLVSKLSKLPSGAMGLLGRGRTYRQLHRGSVAHGVARAIVAIYNTGRRRYVLPDWDDREKPVKAKKAA